MNGTIQKYGTFSDTVSNAQFNPKKSQVFREFIYEFIIDIYFILFSKFIKFVCATQDG